MDKINFFESEPFKIEPIVISEVIIQITASNGNLFALTNFGNVYIKGDRLSSWEKVENIDFEKFNND